MRDFKINLKWMAAAIVGLLVSTAQAQMIQGEYLVKVEPSQLKSFVGQFVDQSEVYISSLKVSQANIFLVKTKNKAQSIAGPGVFAHPGVMHIEPNQKVQLFTVNDPMFEVSWGLQNFGNNEPRRGGGRFPVPGLAGADSNIFPAWEITKGNRRIKIAVTDTGIDYTHPDLQKNIWQNESEINGVAGQDDDGNGCVDDFHGCDFVSNDGNPMDDHRHGTHVSGIIAAEHDNKIGIAGVMNEVSLVGVKFMDAKGRGSLDQALGAFSYAKAVGADIVNASWGIIARSELMAEAVTELEQAGIIVVAAAGNSYLNNDTSPRYPAAFEHDNVITIAAYNAENRLTHFSCYGPETVDIAAPGGNIMSSVPGGGFKVMSGTSMSAPYVSGAIGLYLSAYLNAGKEKPSMAKIKSDLLATNTPVPHLQGKILTGGRLNIGDFLAAQLTNDSRPFSAKPD